jgi:hypothetical protein
MEPKKPLFPLNKEDKKGKKSPWNAILDQTEEYVTQISELLNKSKSATRALFECLEEEYSQIHDPRDGEDGGIHLDNFDHTEFEKLVQTVLDVYLFQELSNMFGLEKAVKARAMEAFILRHPNLHPLSPPVRRAIQAAQQPQLAESGGKRPTPPPRVRPRMWTGKKE